MGQSIKRLLVTVWPVFFALFASCSGGPITAIGGAAERSALDVNAYAAGNLERLAVSSSVAVGGPAAGVAAADVVGDSAMEFVVLDGTTIRLFSVGGEPVAEFPLPDGAFHLSLVGDADGDGKAELVLGAESDGAARFLIVKGDGTTMRDVALVSMSRARTRPRALVDGLLYFDAVSWSFIAPKVVGAYDIAADQPVFIHHMGPVPNGVSVALGAELMAVSHIAAEKDRPDADIPVPYTSASDRHAILILDGNGAIRHYTPLGPQAREGSVVQGGISSLDLRLLPGARQNDEYRVLAVAQRMSDLYVGPTTASLYSLAGEELSRFEGDPNTTATVCVFADTGAMRVALVFDHSGRVVVLDDSLEPVAEGVLPGSSHDAVLRGVGDYNGDGAPEYIVSDHNKIYVLGPDLETTFATGFDSAVEDVAVAPGPGDVVRLAVLAHRVEFLAVGDDAVGGVTLHSTPPGAVFFLNDERVDPVDLPALTGLAPGEYVVRAVYPDAAAGLDDRVSTVTVGAGDHVEVRADFFADNGDARGRTAAGFQTAPKPVPPACYEDLTLNRQIPGPFAGFSLFVDEFLSTPGLELLFHEAATGEIRVVDRFGTVRAAFGLVDRRSAAVVGARMGYSDLDGDGFSDLSLLSVRPGFTGFSADGRPILSKHLFYGNDTTIRGYQSFWFDDRLFIPASTAYLQGPDVVFALDPESHNIDYTYPLGAFSDAPVVHNGLAYFPMYTFNNGNVVTYPDGSVATDGAFYISVMGPGGVHHPRSYEPEVAARLGSLRLFHFDVDGDGGGELHYSLGYDPDYYPGRSAIFRIHDDGSTELVWTGLENGGVLTSTVLTPRGEHLVVISFRDNRVDILGPGYNHVGTFQQDASRAFIDLDQDGAIEKMYVEDGAVVFASMDGAPVRALRNSIGAYTLAVLRDLDRDGLSEVLAWNDQQVDIWRAVGN